MSKLDEQNRVFKLFDGFSSPTFGPWLLETFRGKHHEYFTRILQNTRYQKYSDRTTDKSYYYKIEFDRGDNHDTTWLVFQYINGKVYFGVAHQPFNGQPPIFSPADTLEITSFEQIRAIFRKYMHLDLEPQKNLFV